MIVTSLDIPQPPPKYMGDTRGAGRGRFGIFEQEGEQGWKAWLVLSISLIDDPQTHPLSFHQALVTENEPSPTPQNWWRMVWIPDEVPYTLVWGPKTKKLRVLQCRLARAQMEGLAEVYSTDPERLHSLQLSLLPKVVPACVRLWQPPHVQVWSAL